jgi:hypothetical protein
VSERLAGLFLLMDNTQLENLDLHRVWEEGRKEANMRNGRERRGGRERASVLPWFLSLSCWRRH